MRELQLGNRIQVKYDLAEEGQEADATVWWGATVKDITYTPDGRTIYRLLYDAYPEGGFDEAEERSIEMGSGPDQIIELDDNLNQLDPQTYRMEPATERGVVPCHDDDDMGGYHAGYHQPYQHMSQWHSYQQQLMQQQQMEQMRHQQHAQGAAGSQAAMQQMLFQLQLQQQHAQRQAGQPAQYQPHYQQ